MSEAERLGLNEENGAHHYRAFVGPSKHYDLCSAMQFNLLTALGLREHHYLLDIGCGSLRAGKLFIPYLLPGRYYGIEPEEWLISEGIELELGEDIFEIKKPMISYDRNFTCSLFDMQFDFLLAQSIFTHASQDQISRCLQEVKSVMKPTSLFVATFSEGEENYDEDEWIYPECVFYGFERIRELANKAGLFCSRLEWLHPDQQKWIVMEKMKAKTRIGDVIHLVNRMGQLRGKMAKVIE